MASPQRSRKEMPEISRLCWTKEPPRRLTMKIRIDDLSGAEIRALLAEHLDDMRAISPPESVHAFDVEALRRPDVTFWTAWSEAGLLACGALRELSPVHGEIKSMRTSRAHRRSGAGRAMLAHIVDEARRRAYERLSLETGSQPPFAPAHRLYESFGFIDCAPFGDYIGDPNSRFMAKVL
jgi:putative acetyltransferase